MDIKPVVPLVPPVRIKKVNPSDTRDDQKQRKPGEQQQPAEQDSPDAKIDTYA